MAVMAKSDLVFTSTAATEPLIERSHLAAVLEPNRPLMLVDISVPRNVHGNVQDIAHVQAFNVDDLKGGSGAKLRKPPEDGNGSRDC